MSELSKDDRQFLASVMAQAQHEDAYRDAAIAALIWRRRAEPEIRTALSFGWRLYHLYRANGVERTPVTPEEMAAFHGGLQALLHAGIGAVSCFPTRTVANGHT